MKSNFDLGSQNLLDQTCFHRQYYSESARDLNKPLARPCQLYTTRLGVLYLWGFPKIVFVGA
jgi:hypothetical protein